MSINEIAERYVALCKAGKLEQILDELFAADAVSVEAFAPPGLDPTSSGLAAIKAKSEWWTQNHEIHRFETFGPFPNGDRFAVRFVLDITNKPSGRRMGMEEIGLFTVENGKISREEFFYQAG
jgi:hypothetical protein